MIGHQSERDFKSIANNNMIKNCPITASTVTNAHSMFGSNFSGTRGKKIQQNTDRVVMDYVAVHRDLLKLHKLVIIVADVMFVNNAPLLIGMSHGVKLVTIKNVQTVWIII